MGETNGRDEVTVSGWGASIGLKGKDLVVSIVVALLFLVGTYVLYAQHSAQELKFDMVIGQLRQMNELNYLQTYQLSRPQDQRLPIYPPAQLWKYLDQDALREKEDAKRK